MNDGAFGAVPALHQSLWFRLLEFCLLQAMDRDGALQSADMPASRVLRPASARLLPPPAQQPPGQCLTDQQWAVLHALLLGFAQQTVAGAAGRVPPRSIAERIIAAAGREGAGAPAPGTSLGPMAGGFRATLLSLLSTCSLEASLLQCARIAAGSDGAALLTLVASACSKPTLVLSGGGGVQEDAGLDERRAALRPEAADGQRGPVAP